MPDFFEQKPLQAEHQTDTPIVRNRRWFLFGGFWGLAIFSILLTGIAIGLTIWLPNIQRERAITTIKQHGGTVHFMPNGHGEWWNNSASLLAVDLSTADLHDDDLQPLLFFDELQQLSIAGKQLTDVGILQLKNLPQLERLVLINCQQISPAAEQQLRDALPRLEISRRGPALLGISGEAHLRGCLISTVREESAAAHAGLRVGDIISRIDLHGVRDFDTLAKIIAKKKPGDKLLITIWRNRKIMQLEATLGAWSKVTHR